MATLVSLVWERRDEEGMVAPCRENDRSSGEVWRDGVMPRTGATCFSRLLGVVSGPLRRYLQAPTSPPTEDPYLRVNGIGETIP